MVTLLEDIDPEYYKYFIYADKRERKCMYAESQKTTYGTLEALQLFWGKLSKQKSNTWDIGEMNTTGVS